MVCYLFVKDPFLGHVRGDLITDIEKIRDILSSDHKRFVTRVALSQALKG